MGRPVTSWAASAQEIRHPRASRPPSGLKWKNASPDWVSLQPHAAHVTGPSRPSRTAETGRISLSDGWIIGVPSGWGPGGATLPHVHPPYAERGVPSAPERGRWGCGQVAAVRSLDVPCQQRLPAPTDLHPRIRDDRARSGCGEATPERSIGHDPVEGCSEGMDVLGRDEESRLLVREDL